MNYNLAQSFYDSADKFSDRLAISAYGKEFSYQEVKQKVTSITAWLNALSTKPKRVGILASRSAEACIAILAAASTGATYIPVNLAFPEGSLIEIMKRSCLDALIADEEGSRLLNENLLEACPPAVLAYRTKTMFPASDSITDYSELNLSAIIEPPVYASPETPGYVLYTSGSTGIPKGVIIPVGAVDHLLSTLDQKYPIRETDRLAETAATTFDISVYNMFATWRAGASLHIVPPHQLMNPARFIRQHEITVWFSVPSIATLMARMKLLKPGALSTLRQTFFCGEPLLKSVAAAWQKAAPSSTIINMYGPTEATVMCTGEDFVPGCAMTRDIVAIGTPFAGMKAAIATPDLNWVNDGQSGELLLSGPQLALGYLDDPEKTQSKFVEIDGQRWYRTGDMSLRDSNGIFHYLGRLDNQVKVLGYRIELEDIESHLREVTGCESVAAIPWPVQNGLVCGIIAFIAHCQKPVDGIKEAMKDRLPSYMVPNQIQNIPELPMNANGKVDRKALVEMANANKLS